MLKDPLIRRFISASIFSAAFVWVAVAYFDVDPEVVWVFLILSFGFVGSLIVVGLFLAPVVRLFNREPPLLSKIQEPTEPIEQIEQIKNMEQIKPEDPPES